MKKQITKRQKDLLTAIYKYIKDSGYPPSFEEMKGDLGVSSNQSVIDLLEKLENQKCIRREEGQARGIKILSKGFELLGVQPMALFVGESAAGSFTESYADIFSQWIPFNKGVVKNEIAKTADEVVVVRVSGDSMINARINNKDVLLVQKTKEFKSGDIVVARNDDQTTIKRFIAEGGRAYLKPENLKYGNLPIFEDTFFEGKVIFNLTTKERIK